MTPCAVRRVGSQALLVELESLDAVLALHARLVDHPLPGQTDLVPAARTLLIKYDSHRSAARAAGRLGNIDAPPIDGRSGRQLTIEVVYDGEDLADVGELTGLGARGVIEAHTSQCWRAAFSGFAPGFVYLAGENDALDVPRRNSPRTAVPAGSVALAGGFSAIYPSRSPGGWQLIGRTNARIWDIDRDQPAMIRAGDNVRHVAVDRLRKQPSKSSAAPDNDPPCDDRQPAIEVVDAGLQSLIQDLGRPGLSHLGVSASGAADETAARQANRLVGNAPGEALIETVLGGLAIRACGDLVIAHSGARAAAHISGPRGRRDAPQGAPFILHGGETLELGRPSHGLRAYLAVRGGIVVPPVLNSRATDTLAGIGPAALAAGRVLPVEPRGLPPVVGTAEPSTLADRDEGGATVMRVVLGPRHDWFSDDVIDRFTAQRWRVTPQSNRIGVRLAIDGENDAHLERSHNGELKSEGMVAGAIQVPPSGLPLLFLTDHPVTGGYPVIAVVTAADLPRAAQLAPGDRVRFLIVDPDDPCSPRDR